MTVTIYGAGTLDSNGFETWGFINYGRKYVSDSASDSIRGRDSYDSPDYLVGGDGNDTLNGGWGLDILQGSSRYGAHSFRDTLIGGDNPNFPQQDIFVIGDAGGNYYNGTGYAVIQDFQADIDTIMLKKGSGGNGGTGIIVDNTRDFGVGSSARDTLISTASGDVLAVIQDQVHSFSYLNGISLTFV